MRKWLLLAAAVVVALLCLAAGALWIVYRTSQRVPEFYRQALKVEPGTQKKASDQMLQRATALTGDVKKEGRWQALFTEDQINGWLAVDLPRNHADSLPAAISNPRVKIEPGSVTLACGYRQGRWQGVLSLTVDVCLSDPDTLALRIRGARAGAIPLPLDTVLAQMAEAGRRSRLKIDWRQADGDPVALVPLQTASQQRATVQIDTLAIRKGEVYVAGTTKRH